MPEKKNTKRSPSEPKVGKSASGEDSPEQAPEVPTATDGTAPENNVSRLQWGVLFAFLSILFLWSYWPTLVHLIDQWSRVPDYSHGFLVAPIAIYFLWITREGFVRSKHSVHWAGLCLILAASLVRFCGTYYYLDALQGWSIPIWVMGLAWMFFGWSTFLWSFPAIAFLIFMVPLPYSIENMLSVPLQNVSTKISLFVLQCMGQPATSEGTTISLGANTLEVARACSGLRIFFGIAALAYAFAMLFKRPIWTKLMLFLAILPITLLANSIRIVSIGLFMQLGMDETAQHLGHDLAGLFMIPLAAGLFAVTLFYLDRLFPMVSSFDAQTMMRSQVQKKATSSN